jgi:hypothetical protein
MRGKVMKRFLVFISVLLFFFFNGNEIQAQTKGLIIKPASVAGRTVLDPNNDGYVSQTDEGFINNDEAESELPFTRMVLPQPEPTSDVRTGPNCGFTDFVDAPDEYSSAYFYLHNDGIDTNLVFRFRLGNYAPNSKGYSVLIDTDGKFGNTGANADPNYVTGNPGFEMEIILTTNFGVRLYNTDGTATPSLLTTLAYNDYAQIAIARSQNCSSNDYFYDFYMPLATIQSYFPTFKSTTSIRMIPNTVINTLSALRGGISDMAGFDNSAYGSNIELAWTNYINLHPPVSLDDAPTGFAPARTVAPFVSSPIFVSATSISGSSTEANGTVIRIYKNGSLLGTTTVNNNSFTLTGVVGLALNDSIDATAEASGKSISLNSNKVFVTQATNCTNVPTLGCSGRKGFSGNGPTSAPTGTTIRIYGPNDPNTLYQTVTTNASNFWIYNCSGHASNCGGGGSNCVPDGTYYISAQIDGNCESAKTVTACINTPGTTTTPVISTNPITPATTTITGTATSGATVYLYKDGYYVTSTTATGGNYTFNSQTFSLGQVVSVYAISGTNCISGAATRTVNTKTATPTVNGPILNGATTVSGISSEAAGTKIYIYRNGTLIDSTTVNAYGNWTKTGLAALTSGQNIKATAIATGKTISDDSNIVTVLGISTAPVITGSYSEAGTSVTGTSGMANGTVIKVYIDGGLLGETTVSGGTWTLSGLSATNYDLYAGGTLTATATGSGLGESTSSAGVTVSCSNPLNTLNIDVLIDSACLNTSAQIMLLNSQSGVIYTLKDEAVSNNRGSSRLGDGDDIILATVRLTQSETFKVHALKLPQTACNTVLTNSATVPVKYPEDISGLEANDYLWLGNSGDSTWNEKGNWIRWNGTAFDLVDAPPTTTNDVVIKKTQSCIHNLPYVVTSIANNSVCRNITIEADATLVMEETDNRILTVTGNWINRGSFIANGGTVRFNGNTTQTIFNQSGTENFNHIIIEESNTVVQLLSDITTDSDGVVTLENGIIDLNEKTLTINNNATNAIVRNQGYILSESQSGAGAVYRNISSNTATNYTFPLGNADGDYIPVTMNLSSGNIGMAGVASYFADLSDTSTSLPQGSDKVEKVTAPVERIQRFWHLYSNQPAETYTVTVAFQFTEAESPINGIENTEADGILMQRYDNTRNEWDAPKPLQTYNHSQKSVSVQGITGFSWWGGGNNNSTSLPITLTSFKANCNNDKVAITWITAAEINSDKFTLLRSSDGTTFEAIASIKAAGNSSNYNQYEYIDNDMISGSRYYTLMQTDWDGTSEIFNTITANCNATSQIISVYPNPAKGYVNISSDKNISEIEIYNTNNQLISSYNIAMSNTANINTEKLSEGVYMLLIKGIEGQYHKKLIVTH